MIMLRRRSSTAHFAVLNASLVVIMIVHFGGGVGRMLVKRHE